MAKQIQVARSKTKQREEPASNLGAIIAKIDAQHPFGPLFFLTQLRAFVRDSCPEAIEALPVVELHLNPPENIEVCHIIGVAPRYVALAVFDEGGSSGSPAMRTELVPYELIMRVTIRAMKPTRSPFGFSSAHAPALIGQDHLMTPEEALRAATTGRVPAAGKPVKRNPKS